MSSVWVGAGLSLQKLQETLHLLTTLLVEDPQDLIGNLNLQNCQQVLYLSQFMYECRKKFEIICQKEEKIYHIMV